MDFAELRASIPATASSIYLNSGFTGPSTKQVVERITWAVAREAEVGPASLEGLAIARAASVEAQEQVAELLNADVDEVLLTHGTTEGCHMVLHGMRWQPGDEVVSCNLEHNALANAMNTIEDRWGVNVKRVELAPNASKADILTAFEAAVTPQTRIVAVSHIQYTCGLKLPIPELVELAHRNDATILVDGAQTGGTVNIDVKKLGVDYYAISGQKWLLGPNGTGAVFVRADHRREIHPLFTTHEVADRRATRGDNDAIINPLQRFRLTSSSPAMVGGFAEAIKIARSVGLEAIEERSMMLANRLRAGLRSLEGCTLTGPTDPASQSALVSIAIDGWEPAKLVEHFWHDLQISVRAVNNPPAIRCSCAAFNTEEEIDRLIDALRDAENNPPPPEEAATTAVH